MGGGGRQSREGDWDRKLAKKIFSRGGCFQIRGDEVERLEQASLSVDSLHKKGAQRASVRKTRNVATQEGPRKDSGSWF